MAGVLQHLRSSTLDKRPNPASMVDGQVAINYASGAPGMFFKDSNGDLVKVGPVHVGSGAPNAVPASGGTAGNSIGEQWLDTSGGTYVFKIWDGSAWRSEAGEFVNVTGDTMTGALGIIAGSEGSPSLFISGDTDTGLYSPGANQLAISTSGTGRLFVDASGNVGVGTASPQELLHVNTGSSGGQVLRMSTNGADTGYLYQNSGSVILGAYSTRFLGFETNGSEHLRLTSDGKLGLGTSSPGYRLDVTSQLGCTYSGAIRHLVNIDSDGGKSYWYNGTPTNTAYILGDTGSAYFAGNVGIGTTSPALKLHVDQGTADENSFTVRNDETGLFVGAYGTGSTYGRQVLVNASRIDGGSFPQLRLAGQGGIVFAADATSERARIDDSGRLLVGTSTQSKDSTLVLEGSSLSGSNNESGIWMQRGTSSPADGNALGRIEFSDNTGDPSAEIRAFRDGGTWSASSKPGRLTFSTTPDSSASPVERMRITNNGEIYLNSTSRVKSNAGTLQVKSTGTTTLQLQNSASGGWSIESYASNNAGTWYYHAFLRDDTNALVGSISSNGTTTSYTTTSDYRLKENIAPITNSVARIKQLKPSQFKFVADPDRIVDGFIAHEAQAVVPECVTGEKDAVDEDGNPVYQGIDQSKLVPLLTAALQEAIGRIETLEAEVAALKGV